MHLFRQMVKRQKMTNAAGPWLKTHRLENWRQSEPNFGMSVARKRLQLLTPTKACSIPGLILEKCMIEINSYDLLSLLSFAATTKNLGRQHCRNLGQPCLFASIHKSLRWKRINDTDSWLVPNLGSENQRQFSTPCVFGITGLMTSTAQNKDSNGQMETFPLTM